MSGVHAVFEGEECKAGGREGIEELLSSEAGGERKVEEDIIKPRNGVVSDEYVDFMLWTKGLKTRQEYFAEYVEKFFPQETYHKLLEVGCGRTARLSELLAAKGYQMWAMDPQVNTQVVRCGA